MKIEQFFLNFRCPPNVKTIRVEQDFSDIFQPIIMLLLIWGVLAISGAMLIVQVGIVEYLSNLIFI